MVSKSTSSSVSVSRSAVVDTNHALTLDHLPTNMHKLAASVECERVEDPGGSKTQAVEMKCSTKLGGVERRASRRALGLFLLMGGCILL